MIKKKCKECGNELKGRKENKNGFCKSCEYDLSGIEIGDVYMNCTNCGNTEFYEDAAPQGNRQSRFPKYICTKCGFKATKMLHKKGNLKKGGLV